MDSILTTLEDALRDCPIGADGALELSDEYLMLVLGGGGGSIAAPPPPPPPPEQDDSLPDHIGHVTTFTEAGATIGAGTGSLAGPAGAAAGAVLGGLYGFALGVGYELNEHAPDAIRSYRDNPPPI